MVCTHCGGETRVVNSRRQRRANQVWRRRLCSACGALFTTAEAIQHERAWRVRRESALEPFSRDKLFLSLYRSCQHRSTALRDAGGLADTVIARLNSRLQDGVLDRRDIVQAVQVALNRFDKAASVSYAAYHRQPARGA